MEVHRLWTGFTTMHWSARKGQYYSFSRKCLKWIVLTRNEIFRIAFLLLPSQEDWKSYWYCLYLYLLHLRVVVQFYPWFKFYFPLFQTRYILPYPWTKENKNWTKDKIKPQHTLFIPSRNVLRGYFYASLNMVAAVTVWILINFVTTLLQFVLGFMVLISCIEVENM